MKIKMRVLAILLAALAVGQIGLKAMADSKPAKIEFVEQQVMVMLQQKSEIEAAGQKLGPDEMKTLEASLRALTDQLAKQNRKAAQMSGDSPGI